MKVKITIAIFLTLAWLPACRHQPIYPETGSLLIVSDPSSSDIFIDGRATGQKTPARLDGIEVGRRTVKLKHYGYKSIVLEVEVRPGEVRRLNLRLYALAPHQTSKITHYGSGRDLAYDNTTQRLYLSHSMINKISEYQIVDSTLVFSRYFNVGMGPGCLACHGTLGRLFVSISDTIKVINLNSGNIDAWSVPDPGARFQRLAFSPDGRAVLAADSLRGKVLVLSPQNGSLQRTINLPGAPSDLVIDGQNRCFYVTLADVQLFLRVDLETGAVLNQMSSGPMPGTIFRDESDTWCGYCNVLGQTFVPVRLASWTAVQTPRLPLPSPLGDYIWSVAYAKNGDNLWVMRTGVPKIGDPGPLPSGRLFLFDINTWNGVGNYTLGEFPLKMVQSTNGRFLYILEYYDIMVIRTDTE